MVYGVRGKLERCKPRWGDGFEPLLSRVVIESVTFRLLLSFFLAVVLLELFDSIPASFFVQRYLIPSVDIASHTHPGCVSRYCSRRLACVFPRLFVRDRSLPDVVFVTVHRLTVRGSMGAWETWVCRGLFKSSSALLKFSLTRKVVLTLASKATLSLGR